MPMKQSKKAPAQAQVEKPESNVPLDPISRFFDRPLGALALRPWSWDVNTSFGGVDVLQEKGKVIVRVDLPGMKAGDIEVAVHGNRLVIQGRRNEEREVTRKDYYYSERASGGFYRAVPLPEGIQDKDAEATYKDGVLEVTLPRPNAQEAKKVKVQVK